MKLLDCGQTPVSRDVVRALGTCVLQAKARLKSGMIDDAPSEERLWRVWCNDFDRAYTLNRVQSVRPA